MRGPIAEDNELFPILSNLLILLLHQTTATRIYLAPSAYSKLVSHEKGKYWWHNRVVCKVKDIYEDYVHEVTQVFITMHKNCCHAINTTLSYKDRWANLALHRPILDLG